MTRTAANWCDGGTDGCSGTGFGTNLDYNPHGYYYVVDFTQNSTVNLQAFDPAFVQVGDTCTDPTPNLAKAKTLTNVPGYPEGQTNTADIARRYAPGDEPSNQSDPGFQYCTGDMLFNDNGNMVRRRQRRTPCWKATVPGDPSSATQVCSPITYPGYSGDVSGLLGSGGTVLGRTRSPRHVLPAVGHAVHGQRERRATSTSSRSRPTARAQATTASRCAASRTRARAAPVDIAGNAYMGIYANVGAANSRSSTSRAFRPPRPVTPWS